MCLWCLNDSLFILDLQQGSVQTQVTHKALTGGESTRERELMVTVQQLLEKYESGWQPVVLQQGVSGGMIRIY